MRGLFSRGWVPVLAGLLGLVVLVGFSAPAMAGDVTACADLSGSSDTRFDLKNNITTTGDCLKFPSNAVFYLNGWTVSGPGVSTNKVGLQMASESFVLGPGIVKAFGTCIGGWLDSIRKQTPPDNVAVEDLVLNQCGTGIWIADGYKVKEVRVHDCTPSAAPGEGMILGQGGFVESSIVRTCDIGVETDENNKIWNLVVTGHSFHGLQVQSGNAVSRTVISHPSSSQTRGIIYNCDSGQGCQDGSNSIEDHGTGKNIEIGTSAVVTQPSENPIFGATNCGGVPVPRTTGGLIGANC